MRSGYEGGGVDPGDVVEESTPAKVRALLAKAESTNFEHKPCSANRVESPGTRSRRSLRFEVRGGENLSVSRYAVSRTGPRGGGGARRVDRRPRPGPAPAERSTVRAAHSPTDEAGMAPGGGVRVWATPQRVKSIRDGLPATAVVKATGSGWAPAVT